MTDIIDYRSSTCTEDKLDRLLDYCDRMEKEEPFTDAEMIGRLFTIYGTAEKAAEELACMEEEVRKTLLCHTQLNYERWITKIEARCHLLKRTLGYVPIFAERNKLAYPLLKEDDILEAKEKLKSMENLPHNNRAKKTMVDVTEAAYYMHDLIFIDLGRILNSLQNLYDDKRMLKESDDKCSQRYNQMMIDYQENEGTMDQLHFLKELDDFIGQNGDNKEVLKAFQSRLEHEALNRPKHGKVAVINRYYLNQKSYFSLIYHSRCELTRDQINSHLYFVCCIEHVKKEIELCMLKEPAVGAYANLFVNRAAQELAELLVPVIANSVNFEHNYHYAALAMALMDMGLIYAEKSNGVQLMNFVNKHFMKGNDKIKSQNQLTQKISKLQGRRFGELEPDDLSRTLLNEEDFNKLKDPYWHCLSIINKVMQKDILALGFASYLCHPHDRTPQIEDFYSIHGKCFRLLQVIETQSEI